MSTVNPLTTEQPVNCMPCDKRGQGLLLRWAVSRADRPELRTDVSRFCQFRQFVPPSPSYYGKIVPNARIFSELFRFMSQESPARTDQISACWRIGSPLPGEPTRCPPQAFRNVTKGPTL